MFIANIFFVFSLTLSGYAHPTSSNNPNVVGYNLGKPDKTLVLPEILREVSDLTDIDATTIACIQDEKGILFIYDIINNKIKQEYNFNADGDYEGITVAEHSVYILRSDGVIFEISDYRTKDFKLTSYATGIPSNNNEGICYDEANHRLLISSKTKVRKEHELKDMRFVYAFDLKTKKVASEPVYSFDVQAINNFANGKDASIHKGSKKKKEPENIKFLPSAIALHPITKDLFLLSSADHKLFIFENGSLKHIENLDHIIFNQAEGITFFKNGDMLISNEGRHVPPTLLRFNYLK